MRSSPEGPLPERMRVIETDLASPAYTVACDEALLEARCEGSSLDTLHLYRRCRPTISLGRFQGVESSVDLELVRDRGIELVRRASGGSAIYTDPGQIIFSLVLSDDQVPEAPLQSYPLLCAGAVAALRSLGVEAEYRPLNDIEVAGRKISGSAQTRRRGAVLHHGTIMADTDLDLMVRVLRPQPGKRFRSRDELTTLRQELGRALGMSEVRAALVNGHRSALHREMVHAPLTVRERELIAEKLREPGRAL